MTYYRIVFGDYDISSALAFLKDRPIINYFDITSDHFPSFNECVKHAHNLGFKGVLLSITPLLSDPMTEEVTKVEVEEFGGGQAVNPDDISWKVKNLACKN